MKLRWAKWIGGVGCRSPAEGHRPSVLNPESVANIGPLPWHCSRGSRVRARSNSRGTDSSKTPPHSRHCASVGGYRGLRRDRGLCRESIFTPPSRPLGRRSSHSGSRLDAVRQIDSGKFRHVCTRGTMSEETLPAHPPVRSNSRYHRPCCPNFPEQELIIRGNWAEKNKGGRGGGGGVNTFKCARLLVDNGTRHGPGRLGRGVRQACITADGTNVDHYLPFQQPTYPPAHGAKKHWYAYMHKQR